MDTETESEVAGCPALVEEGGESLTRGVAVAAAAVVVVVVLAVAVKRSITLLARGEVEVLVCCCGDVGGLSEGMDA